MTHFPPILIVDYLEYFYLKTFLNDTTVYNYSKPAVMSASDSTETVYRGVRIIMQLMQCRVSIRNFDDV